MPRRGFPKKRGSSLNRKRGGTTKKSAGKKVNTRNQLKSSRNNTGWYSGNRRRAG